MNYARSRLRDWLLYAVAAQNEQVGNIQGMIEIELLLWLLGNWNTTG